MVQRAGSLLLAAGIAAASAFAALVGTLWGFTLKCDDTCSNGPRWRDDPTSWQWEALGWVAVAGFASGLLFLGAIALRWRWLSSATLAGWGVLAVTYLRLFRDSGLTSNPGRGWAAIALLLVAGVTAIVLTRPPARRTRPG